MALTQNAQLLPVFWELLESRGGDAATVFRRLHLDPLMSRDPSARIPYEKIEHLWEALALQDPPEIGLQYVDYFHPAHLGALGYAWLASASLKKSIQRLVKYGRVLSDAVYYETQESDGLFTVTRHYSEGSKDIPLQVVASTAVLVAFCRMNFGRKLELAKVTFRQEKSGSRNPYFGFFQCPVSFESDQDAVVIDLDTANRTLSTARPELAGLNDQVMNRYLANLSRDNIVERVKSAIIELLPNGGVSDEVVADQLFMNVRTLQRKLQQQGTTFKSLLNETRRELAEQYIVDSRLSLSEISFLLGFAEISSFSRAFKRWKGMSPSTLRSQQPTPAIQEH